MTAPEVVLDGLAFPECARWHQGELWLVDMYAGVVLRTDLTGEPVVVATLDDHAGGLGWLPDGTTLVVSMRRRELLRLTDGAPVVHAHLDGHAVVAANDLCVDAAGRAYVGHFGFDLSLGEAPRPASLLAVAPDGTVSVAADDLLFPNGCVLTPDGRTLIVAETFAGRITAFDVDADGSLGGRRTFAAVPAGTRADAICLDAAGAVWMASPATGDAIRVEEGGRVTDRVPSGRAGCYGCALGGDDGRTLFLCAADDPVASQALARRTGRVVAATVDVPAAAPEHD